MLLCVDAAWAKRMSLSLKLSSHWKPCKLPRTERKGKNEVTKRTMKGITRFIRALRQYQKRETKQMSLNLKQETVWWHLLKGVNSA